MRSFLLWIVLLPSFCLLAGCAHRVKEDEEAARRQEEPQGPVGDFLKEWEQADFTKVDRDKFPQLGSAFTKADSLFRQAREVEILISSPIDYNNTLKVYGQFSLQLVQLTRLSGELSLLWADVLKNEIARYIQAAGSSTEQMKLLTRGMALVVDIIPSGQKWIRKNQKKSKMRRDNKELIAALDSFHHLVSARRPVDTSVLDRTKMPRSYDYFVKANALFVQMNEMDSCLAMPLKRAQAQEHYAFVCKNYEEVKALVTEMNALVDPVKAELKVDPGIGALFGGEFQNINEGTKLYFKVSAKGGTLIGINIVD